MNSDPVQQPRKAVKKVGRDGARCVFSETYMAGRLLVGADLRAARGEWGASRKPAGSEIRPYQNRTSSGTMSNPALRQSVISVTTPSRLTRYGARPSPDRTIEQLCFPRRFFRSGEGWPLCHPILLFLFCAVLQSLCERVSAQNIRARGETYGPTSGVEGQTIRSRGENYLPTSSVENTTSMEVLDDKRPLRAGDRLSMRVVEDRKPPMPLVVTDSGEVEVPLIGRVMAKGKTCKQFAYLIKGPLEREYYYKATVIIGLDFEGHVSPGRVYVTGQVRNQGPIEIPPDETFTVSRAIIKAGGFADFANKRKVKLVRKNSLQTIIVDVDTIVRKGRIDKDPAVEPEDTIIVPERLINF